MGFILIIAFHILCFFGAVLIVAGIPVSSDSSSTFGVFFYYSTLLTGVVSFIVGAFGSIGLLLKRATDESLKAYATPLNYFSYLFTLVVFLSGLYAWAYADPTLAEYREFWVGLITLQYVDVMPATAIHVIIFDFFLIYLPFTRSFHYVTRFFAYFLIRWEDTPNLRGSDLEKKLEEMFKEKITWSAPHIKSGQTWGEAAKNINDALNLES